MADRRQVLPWERQAEEIWGQLFPHPFHLSFNEVSHKKKHAIVSAPSLRTRPQKFYQEEQADPVTDSSESLPKGNDFICKSVKFMPEGAGCSDS